jgi:hypothetical protein
MNFCDFNLFKTKLLSLTGFRGAAAGLALQD